MSSDSEFTFEDDEDKLILERRKRMREMTQKAQENGPKISIDGFKKVEVSGKRLTPHWS